MMNQNAYNQNAYKRYDKSYPVDMMSGSEQPKNNQTTVLSEEQRRQVSGQWTSGNILSWVIGVGLGLLLGLMILIIIPKTLGGKAASTTESAAASAPAAATSAAPAEGATATAPASETGATEATGGAEAGKTFFASNCAGCHGANAEGGVGPKLDKAAAWNLEQFGSAVHEGKTPEKTLAAMMPHFTKEQVSDAQLSDVHTFLQQTFGVKSDAAASAAAQDTASTAASTAPAAGEGNTDEGKAKFASTCAGCHGANAEGGVGPALNVTKDWTTEQFSAAVREGKAPEKTLAAMMPHFTTDQVSDAELNNIHAFIKTLN